MIEENCGRDTRYELVGFRHRKKDAYTKIDVNEKRERNKDETKEKPEQMKKLVWLALAAEANFHNICLLSTSRTCVETS